MKGSGLMKDQDTIKEVKEFTYDKCIIRVHIPDLTEEERSNRMKQLHRAAENLLKEKVKTYEK